MVDRLGCIWTCKIRPKISYISNFSFYTVDTLVLVAKACVIVIMASDGGAEPPPMLPLFVYCGHSRVLLKPDRNLATCLQSPASLFNTVVENMDVGLFKTAQRTVHTGGQIDGSGT